MKELEELDSYDPDERKAAAIKLITMAKDEPETLLTGLEVLLEWAPSTHDAETLRHVVSAVMLLWTKEQVAVLEQQHQGSVRLPKDIEQSVQHLGQNRVGVQCTPQGLGDLQYRL